MWMQVAMLALLVLVGVALAVVVFNPSRCHICGQMVWLDAVMHENKPVHEDCRKRRLGR